jgi:hypothetical protein
VSLKATTQKGTANSFIKKEILQFLRPENSFAQENFRLLLLKYIQNFMYTINYRQISSVPVKNPTAKVGKYLIPAKNIFLKSAIML